MDQQFRVAHLFTFLYCVVLFVVVVFCCYFSFCLFVCLRPVSCAHFDIVFELSIFYLISLVRVLLCHKLLVGISLERGYIVNKRV
jgi:hypothetical protein